MKDKILSHNATSTIITIIGSLIIWGLTKEVGALLVGIGATGAGFDRDRFIRKQN
jgi:hypothetical protein